MVHKKLSVFIGSTNDHSANIFAGVGAKYKVESVKLFQLDNLLLIN